VTCSIPIERGRTLVLGAARRLAGFPPSTTGRFSGVHRGRPGLTTGLPLSEEFALHVSQDPGHGRIVIFQALISLAPANWSLSGHVMDPSTSQLNRSLPVSDALAARLRGHGSSRKPWLVAAAGCVGPLRTHSYPMRARFECGSWASPKGPTQASNERPTPFGRWRGRRTMGARQIFVGGYEIAYHITSVPEPSTARLLAWGWSGSSLRDENSCHAEK
jgi:hypothetical protein